MARRGGTRRRWTGCATSTASMASGTRSGISWRSAGLGRRTRIRNRRAISRRLRSVARCGNRSSRALAGSSTSSTRLAAACGTHHALRHTGSACYGAVIDMVRSVNTQIKSLAPVLNAQTVTDGHVEGSTIRTMTKWHGGHFYVFAGSRNNAASTGTWSLPCVGNATAVRLGESGSVRITGGSFDDHFADGNAIHIYRIDGGSTCGLPPGAGGGVPGAARPKRAAARASAVCRDVSLALGAAEDTRHLHRRLHGPKPADDTSGHTGSCSRPRSAGSPPAAPAGAEADPPGPAARGRPRDAPTYRDYRARRKGKAHATPGGSEALKDRTGGADALKEQLTQGRGRWRGRRGARKHLRLDRSVRLD